MADETPEQIRERVMSEELAKGSDPRVAEGRAKAAEVRARHGLPIDPEQAWRAKLEQEGGAPSAAPAPTAVAEAEAPAAPTAEVSEEEVAEAPVAAPPEAEAAAEPAAAEPPAAPPAEAPPAPVEVPASRVEVPPAPPPEPESEPEIGELIEVETEDLEEFAGIKVREARLPAWLLTILILIPLWAVFYLMAFAGSEAVQRTSGCELKADHTFACFGQE